MRCYVKHFAYISVINAQKFCVVFCPLCGCLFVSAHYLCIRVLYELKRPDSYFPRHISARPCNQGLVTWLLPPGTPGLECVVKEAIQPRDHAKGGRGTLTRLLPQRT